MIETKKPEEPEEPEESKLVTTHDNTKKTCTKVETCAIVIFGVLLIFFFINAYAELRII